MADSMWPHPLSVRVRDKSPVKISGSSSNGNGGISSRRRRQHHLLPGNNDRHAGVHPIVNGLSSSTLSLNVASPSPSPSLSLSPSSTLVVPLVHSDSAPHSINPVRLIGYSNTRPSFIDIILHPETHPSLQAIKSVSAQRAIEAAQIQEAIQIYGPQWNAPDTNNTNPSVTPSAVPSSSSPHSMSLRAAAFAHPDVQVRLLLFWVLARPKRPDGQLTFQAYRALYHRIARRLLGRAYSHAAASKACDADWARDWGGLYPGASLEFSKTQGLSLQPLMQSLFEMIDIFIKRPLIESIPLGPTGRIVKLPNYDAYIEAIEKLFADITHRTTVEPEEKVEQSESNPASSAQVRYRFSFKTLPDLASLSIAPSDSSSVVSSRSACRAYSLSAIWSLLQHPDSDFQKAIRGEKIHEAEQDKQRDEEETNEYQKEEEEEAKEEKSTRLTPGTTGERQPEKKNRSDGIAFESHPAPASASQLPHPVVDSLSAISLSPASSSAGLVGIPIAHSSSASPQHNQNHRHQAHTHTHAHARTTNRPMHGPTTRMTTHTTGADHDSSQDHHRQSHGPSPVHPHPSPPPMLISSLRLSPSASSLSGWSVADDDPPHAGVGVQPPRHAHSSSDGAASTAEIATGQQANENTDIRNTATTEPTPKKHPPRQPHRTSDDSAIGMKKKVKRAVIIVPDGIRPVASAASTGNSPAVSAPSSRIASRSNSRKTLTVSKGKGSRTPSGPGTRSPIRAASPSSLIPAMPEDRTGDLLKNLRSLVDLGKEKVDKTLNVIEGRDCQSSRSPLWSLVASAVQSRAMSKVTSPKESRPITPNTNTNIKPVILTQEENASAATVDSSPDESTDTVGSIPSPSTGTVDLAGADSDSLPPVAPPVSRRQLSATVAELFEIVSSAHSSGGSATSAVGLMVSRAREMADQSNMKLDEMPEFLKPKSNAASKAASRSSSRRGSLKKVGDAPLSLSDSLGPVPGSSLILPPSDDSETQPNPKKLKPSTKQQQHQHQQQQVVQRGSDSDDDVEPSAQMRALEAEIRNAEMKEAEAAEAEAEAEAEVDAAEADDGVAVAESDASVAVPSFPSSHPLSPSSSSYDAAIAAHRALLTTASSKNTWLHNQVLLAKADADEVRAERKAEMALAATLRRTRTKAARIAEQQRLIELRARRQALAEAERNDRAQRRAELEADKHRKQVERMKELRDKRIAVHTPRPSQHNQPKPHHPHAAHAHAPSAARALSSAHRDPNLFSFDDSLDSCMSLVATPATLFDHLTIPADFVPLDTRAHAHMHAHKQSESESDTHPAAGRSVAHDTAAVPLSPSRALPHAAAPPASVRHAVAATKAHSLAVASSPAATPLNDDRAYATGGTYADVAEGDERDDDAEYGTDNGRDTNAVHVSEEQTLERNGPEYTPVGPLEPPGPAVGAHVDHPLETAHPDSFDSAASPSPVVSSSDPVVPPPLSLSSLLTAPPRIVQSFQRSQFEVRRLTHKQRGAVQANEETRVHPNMYTSTFALPSRRIIDKFKRFESTSIPPPAVDDACGVDDAVCDGESGSSTARSSSSLSFSSDPASSDQFSSDMLRKFVSGSVPIPTRAHPTRPRKRSNSNSRGRRDRRAIKTRPAQFAPTEANNNTNASGSQSARTANEASFTRHRYHMHPLSVSPDRLKQRQAELLHRSQTVFGWSNAMLDEKAPTEPASNSVSPPRRRSRSPRRPPPSLASSLARSKAAQVDWRRIDAVPIKRYAQTHNRTVPDAPIGRHQPPSLLEEDFRRFNRGKKETTQPTAPIETDETRKRDDAFRKELATQFTRGLAVDSFLPSGSLFSSPSHGVLASVVDPVLSARHERMGHSIRFEPKNSNTSEPAEGRMYEEIRERERRAREAAARGELKHIGRGARHAYQDERQRQEISTEYPEEEEEEQVPEPHSSPHAPFSAARDVFSGVSSPLQPFLPPLPAPVPVPLPVHVLTKERRPHHILAQAIARADKRSKEEHAHAQLHAHAHAPASSASAVVHPVHAPPSKPPTAGRPIAHTASRASTSKHAVSHTSESGGATAIHDGHSVGSVPALPGSSSLFASRSTSHPHSDTHSDAAAIVGHHRGSGTGIGSVMATKRTTPFATTKPTNNNRDHTPPNAHTQATTEPHADARAPQHTHGSHAHAHVTPNRPHAPQPSTATSTDGGSSTIAHPLDGVDVAQAGSDFTSASTAGTGSIVVDSASSAGVDSAPHSPPPMMTPNHVRRVSAFKGSRPSSRPGTAHCQPLTVSFAI